MAKPLTTNKLVASIRRRASLPKSNKTYSTSEIIDVINEKLSNSIASYLLHTKEDYLVMSEDTALTTANLLSQIEVEIPYRAIGAGIRTVTLLSNGTRFGLTKIDYEDSIAIENSLDNMGYTNSFYILNDKIVLPRTTVVADTLRMHFFVSLSDLVEEKYGSIVTNINRTTGEISVDKIPSTFEIGSEYDFTRAKTPNRLLSYDNTITGLNTNAKIITFDPSSIPENLVVGDYITLAQESIVPQIPVELHSILAQQAALECLESLGDTEAVALAKSKLNSMTKSTSNLISNRSETSNTKINGKYTTIRQSSKRFRG